MNNRLLFVGVLTLMLTNVFGSSFVFDDVQPIYVDEELSSLWESLTDIYHPSWEDYKRVEYYLRYGDRPYLDVVFNYRIEKAGDPSIGDEGRQHRYWHRMLQGMMLVGPNEELPQLQILALGGASEEDRSKCVVLYASYDADSGDRNSAEKRVYDKRLFDIIEDLTANGYCGHVLYRVGGFPLIERGGIRLVHVPYSFKLLSIIEASLLGYENILWLDSSVHPVNNLNKVFYRIAKRGALLLTNGVHLDYEYGLHLYPVTAVYSAGLALKNLSAIPHIPSCAIGFSFNHPTTHHLIREWYRLSTMVYPAMTLYPEEFILSVAAWRTGVKPIASIYNYMDFRSKTPRKPRNVSKPFWLDKA